ncbi:MAG: hypothetical protein U5N58_10340 [Actinomycetota bacterium]|nr:hypothetical protein [Actinomycetota bacterium]
MEIEFRKGRQKEEVELKRFTTIYGPNKTTAEDLMEPQKPEKICGVLERIVFNNQETSFLVGRLRLDNTKRLATIVGSCPDMECGQHLEVNGQLV